jgi:hypothetical protein
MRQARNDYLGGAVRHCAPHFPLGMGLMEVFTTPLPLVIVPSVRWLD